jgi:hypothetical protein
LTLQLRIVNDINAIKGKVSVPVTTAQRQGDWCGGMASGCDPNRSVNNNPPNPSLNQVDNYGVLTTVHAIGANIFPYWGGSTDHPVPEKINGVSMASFTQATATDLLTALANKGVKAVIVTEEGWPSCSNVPPQNPTTIADEIDYFHTWSKHANQAFDSYYFQAYDLAENIACNIGGESGDANLHFGLCAVSGMTKDSGLIGCE